MSKPDSTPELRLVPAETADEVAKRFEREKRRVDDTREADLSKSLGGFRVGSVSYLNSVPLTRGLEEQVEFMPPAQLAEKLRKNELDAALVSITEVLFNDCYDVLDGIAVASLGEVFSVFLAHRIPLDEVKTIYCDPASLTSVNLLKVLMAERGQSVQLEILDSYSVAPELDAVLLIGNPAIEFRQANHPHAIWDLGDAWHESTKLPFVFAVWALRRGIANESLRRQLREARDFGMDTLDHIISTREEFDRNFRKDYLGWHIHFHLGTDEREGIRRFIELLRKHQSEIVYDPKFVA